MQVVDKDSKTWFVHTGAFRLPMPDADDASITSHIFEPGIKYRIHQTEWMKGQPTIIATDMDADVEVQKPREPRMPKVEREK